MDEFHLKRIVFLTRQLVFQYADIYSILIDTDIMSQTPNMSPTEEDLLAEEKVAFHMNNIIVKFLASQQEVAEIQNHIEKSKVGSSRIYSIYAAVPDNIAEEAVKIELKGSAT